MKRMILTILDWLMMLVEPTTPVMYRVTSQGSDALREASEDAN
jgi:hypothetical protein